MPLNGDKSMRGSQLAINGGPEAKEKPLPNRRFFDEEALESVIGVFKGSWREVTDFSSHGKY